MITQVNTRRRPRQWENYNVIPQAPVWPTMQPIATDMPTNTAPTNVDAMPQFAPPPTQEALPSPDEYMSTPQQEMTMIAELADMAARGITDAPLPPGEIDLPEPPSLAPREVEFDEEGYQDWSSKSAAEKYKGIPISKLRPTEIAELSKEESQREKLAEQRRKRELYEQVTEQGKSGLEKHGYYEAPTTPYPKVATEFAVPEKAEAQREAIRTTNESIRAKNKRLTKASLDIQAAYEARTAPIRQRLADIKEKRAALRPPTQRDIMEHEMGIEHIKAGAKQKSLPTDYLVDLQAANDAIGRGADPYEVFRRIALKYPDRSSELKRIFTSEKAQDALQQLINNMMSQ